MNHSKADRETIAEMRDLLEQESRKPAGKRDYDLIEQLSDAIYESTTTDNLDKRAEQNIEKLTVISAKNTRHIRKMRWVRRSFVLVACAALCIGLNIWTMHAFGVGLTTAIYQITKGGISLRSEELDMIPIELLVTEDDPYGIQTECERHGFSPMTPAYLPDGLILTTLDTNDAKLTAVNFHYRNSQDQSKVVFINYTYIEDQQIYDNTDHGFPSDQYNIETKVIGGKNVLISWEDEVFHALFCDNDKHIIYNVCSNHIGYDESYQVLCSFFE